MRCSCLYYILVSISEPIEEETPRWTKEEFNSIFSNNRSIIDESMKEEFNKIYNSLDIDDNKNVLSPSSSSSEGSSSSESSNGSLPLMIAIPAGVAIIAVTIAIYILQRRRCFNSQSNTHRNTRFNPVPTQERENFPTPIHTNPHVISSAPTSSRSGDKVTNNPGLDFYSDISSVSRCHHQQHNNLQYGY